MNRSVEPIRNRKAIDNIKTTLKKQKHPRDYLLFTLGINTAFRASDILKLKVNDILEENGKVKTHIKIRQQKTKKWVSPKVNKSIREAIEFYRKNNGHLEPSDYLFRSYRSKTKLDSVSFWNLIKKWTAHLDGDYGTHSLRKTCGYHMWRAGIDREIIMLKLGKNSYQDTKRYLGIAADEVEAAEDLVCL